MKSANQSIPDESTPVMSLASAMKTMGQVLRGEIDVPNEFPKAKAFFNDESAKQWHLERSHNQASSASRSRKSAIAPTASAAIVQGKIFAVANSSQFAAFAKLYVDNGELLSVLANEGADSTASLARRLSKDPGNVGRTLKKLEAYGIVRFISDGLKIKRPVLSTKEVDFKVDFRSGQIHLRA